MNETNRRPIHVAFHYLGCAVRSDDGIHVPSVVGPLLETLSDAVTRVSVVAYDPPSAPSFEDRVEYVIGRPNVDFVSLGPKGTFRDVLRRRRAVRRAMTSASGSWDVLVQRVPHRRMMVVARASRCPRTAAWVIAMMRSNAPAELSAVGRVVRALAQTWTTLQFRRFMRRVKLAFINSEELRRVVDRPWLKIVMLHISQRRERHVYEAADRMTSAAGPELLLAGRLTLEKGVLDAIDVLAHVKGEMDGARLHIAGEGPALDAMLARADELGVCDAVVQHGWVPGGDPLSNLYSQMDVLLFPSFAAYEAFPCVVWEALAHSLLVVTTPIGGLPAVLTHEQEVLYVEPHEPASMAAAVKRLKDDPSLRANLLRTGFEKARSSSLEAIVERFVDAIYETWPELPLVPSKVRR